MLEEDHSTWHVRCLSVGMVDGKDAVRAKTRLDVLLIDFPLYLKVIKMSITIAVVTDVLPVIKHRYWYNGVDGRKVLDGGS